MTNYHRYPMTFFQAYRQYVGKTELPETFITWGAITTFAAAIAHNVSLQRSAWKVKPNLYVIYLATPGVGKSVALNFSTRLIRKSQVVMLAPTAITVESLYELLSADKDSAVIKDELDGKLVKKAPLFLAASELITLLGTEPHRMVEFLTNVWDIDEFKVSTKNKGSNHIQNPALTILGCMTPGKMTKEMSAVFLSGGFSRRCIFVSGEVPKTNVPFMEFTPEQAEAEAICIAKLKQANKMRGSLSFSSEAEAAYVAWYAENKKLLVANNHNALGSYYSTLRELVLKIAILFAVERGELILSAGDITQAVEVLAPTAQDMVDTFSAHGTNPLQAVSVEIEKVLRSQGTLSRPQIHAMMFSSAAPTDIDKTLAHMVSTGRLALSIESDTHKYKLKTG